MKTKIIGVLFILILIVGAILFWQVQNKSEEYASMNTKLFTNNVNTVSNDKAEIKNVDTETIENQVADFDESDFESSEETVINLSDENTTVNGKNVKVDGSNIYITGEGTYRITGTLSNGRIIVNAPKLNVKIILDNANITCSYSSPLFVYKSAKTYIYLEDGSTNTLTDGENYSYLDDYSSEEDEEPNAALYSKSDLVIAGKGKLIVKANNNNAITSKDTLYIKDATIEVDAKNHGINGKDNCTIENAEIIITSGGDGIRSTNDTDETLGWIKISDSNIKINSAEDGIQAETDLSIYGGTFNITSGGGASNGSKINNNVFGRDAWGRNSSTSSSSETSMKGIKASRYLLIDNNSSIVIDSADDAIHSNGSVEINSGNINIKTGDDGVHADDTLTINGGAIVVSESYEGLEGNNIVINDGDIDVTSSDDGINVNGGNDSSGFGGFGGGMKNGNMRLEGNMPDDASGFERGSRNKQALQKPSGDIVRMNKPNDNGENNFDASRRPEDMEQSQVISLNSTPTSSYKLIINGGNILVNANGDGLDSNGAIEMNGGNVIVDGPTNSGNGALDYNTSFTLNGGTIIAIGASGMSQGVTSTSQGSVKATLSSTQSAGTKIEIKDENGKTILETTSKKSFNDIVASSKEMKENNSYSIYINGTLATSAKASLDTGSSGFGGFGR